MTTQNGVVDLDALTSVKKVRLGGKELVVKDVDGVGYQLLKTMRAEGKEESVDIMYKVAARCLPLSEEEVLQLTAAQVGAVLELAASKVDLVEATVPKARTARKKGAASP